MRYPITSALLVMLLPLCPQSQAGEPSLGDQLEKLAPKAAGVALVEVLEIKEVDGRGGDGDLYLDVRLRIIRGTGTTPSNIYITLERGGNPGKISRPWKPYGPVKKDTFKKGERYWIAFSSPFDSSRCPQGVVNSWPEKDGPKVLDEAVRADACVHRPIYDATHDLTYSYRAADDKKSWRIRMERDGKLLWEVDLPGEKFQGTYPEWRFLNRSQLPIDLGYEKENPSGVFLFAEAANSLEDGNPYQLPAGKYRFRYALNADDGKTATISVSRFDRSDASVIQGFDPKTRKIGREERYDLLEKGGLAAGAKEEQWLRKIVRTYDCNTGKLKSEETLRWIGSSTYVPVGK